MRMTTGGKYPSMTSALSHDATGECRSVLSRPTA